MRTEVRMEKSSRCGRSRQRGFTIIEILVVVVILGSVLLIGIAETSKMARKTRLAAASNDVMAFLQRVPLEMQSRGRVMFIRLTAVDGTTGRRSLQMIADTNPAPSGNGSLENLDTVVQTLEVPEYISFSRDTIGELQTNIFDVSGTGTSAVLAVGVDFRGRTIRPGGAQIGGIATISMLHNDMVGVAPSLKPPMDYQLRIGPVWNPSVVKLTKGHDAGFP